MAESPPADAGPHLLLDAYSLLFRAFYALPPMTTRAGEPTGALYGTSSLLLKLLREERPRAVAWAVDAPQRTVRHAVEPTYKAGRAPTPDPLRAQLARLPELAAAAGLPLHQAPGWEADDLLASLARRLPPALVVSGDTDLLQIVDSDTTVLFVGRRQKDHVRYDPTAVEARYGFAPERIPTWKALVGDPSDNLAGVAGIGPKTATRLVQEHGDAEGILAAAGSLPARTRATLEAAADDLRRVEGLATVRRDLPLELPLAAEVDYQGLRDWFVGMEFASLVKRVEGLAAR